MVSFGTSSSSEKSMPASTRANASISRCRQLSARSPSRPLRCWNACRRCASRLRRDQVGQTLDRGQIHAAVLEGPAGELARLGMTQALELPQRRQHRRDHGAAAVHLQLGDVLAGLAVGAGEPERQALIDAVAGCGIAHPRQRRPPRLRDAADQLFQGHARARTRDADDRDRRRRPAGREREDGVAVGGHGTRTSRTRLPGLKAAINVRASACQSGGRRQRSAFPVPVMNTCRLDGHYRHMSSMSHRRVPRKPSRRRDQPLSAAAQAQPGRLVAVGDRGAGGGEKQQQADPALGRLCRLSLVPRHGARELRGRGHRRGDERPLRQHQSGPRGASRHRSDLHVGAASPGRARRLAAHHVPDARGRAVLGRHLSSQDLALRQAGLRRSPARGRARVPPGAAERRAESQRADGAPGGDGAPQGPRRDRRSRSSTARPIRSPA